MRGNRSLGPKERFPRAPSKKGVWGVLGNTDLYFYSSFTYSLHMVSSRAERNESGVKSRDLKDNRWANKQIPPLRSALASLRSG